MAAFKVLSPEEILSYLCILNWDQMVWLTKINIAYSRSNIVFFSRNLSSILSLALVILFAVSLFTVQNKKNVSTVNNRNPVNKYLDF